MMAEFKNSEFRAYLFIERSLAELGWNIKNPATSPDGAVYTQRECLSHPHLKERLQQRHPENVVKITENTFWVIEAKHGHDHLEQAKKEAFEYAEAINKRHRAKVLASLLLALIEDEHLKISDSPTILIQDINARVGNILAKHGKKDFAQEITLHLPTSSDNHRKHRRALVDALQELKKLNIRSAINSNQDILGQFHETFLKYANDAKEIGIVLTPRHITAFASEVLNITHHDYIYDPACGTGGFLVAALDRVKRISGSPPNEFKESHIYGVEQDPEIVALALVNMIL